MKISYFMCYYKCPSDVTIDVMWAYPAYEGHIMHVIGWPKVFVFSSGLKGEYGISIII